jgi:hypothetical protein
MGWVTLLDAQALQFAVPPALALGLRAFAIGLALIEQVKGRFPSRVQIEPRDLLIILTIVVAVCLPGRCSA